jgi:hypothetical protein
MENLGRGNNLEANQIVAEHPESSCLTRATNAGAVYEWVEHNTG